MSRHITSARIALATLFALTNILSVEWIYTSANALTISDRNVAGSPLIINEVDSDTPGSDLAEFVEIYDGGLGNTPLDGYVVVFFNGGAANDASYASFDLDGFTTNATGFFTLGNAAVPGVDLIFANGGLQNGPDAVAIFLGNGGDFPNGTPVTIANIVDALVYSNSPTIDAGLLVLHNAGQAQVNENSTGAGATVSMQRLPNGAGGARNTDTYRLLTPTPDRANLGPTAAAMSLSGRVTDASGRGIRNAILTLDGGALLEPRSIATGSFGYYGFDGLQGGTYILTVNTKRYTFAVPSRTFTLADSVTDANFVADPRE